jgi:hypothetical protein
MITIFCDFCQFSAKIFKNQNIGPRTFFKFNVGMRRSLYVPFSKARRYKTGCPLFYNTGSRAMYRYYFTVELPRRVTRLGELSPLGQLFTWVIFEMLHIGLAQQNWDTEKVMN